MPPFSHGQFGTAPAERWIGLELFEGRHFALHAASVGLPGIDPHHPIRRTVEFWNERSTLHSGATPGR